MSPSANQGASQGSQLEDKFRRAVHERGLLNPGDHVILGLSGGADSMALLLLLMNLPGITVHPVHVNHMIRGEDADSDQQFVEEFCRRNGLDCRSVRFDCVAEARMSGMTEEEAGRAKRYRVFDEFAEELVSDGIGRDRVKVATAHHADDQAETILLHLLRGSGTDGLAGMAYERRDERGFSHIRPLLDCRKQELREFCGECGIEPREDRTNEDPSYGRNRIRLELIPYLEEYNPRIVEALLRTGESARDDRAYLEEQAGELLRKYASVRDNPEAEDGKIISIMRKSVSESPRALRRRAVRLAFEAAGLKEDFTARHIEAVDELLAQERPSAEVDLPHGFRARVVYDRLEIAEFQSYRQSQKNDAGENPVLGTVRILPAEKMPKGIAKGSFAAFDLGKLQEVYGPDAAQKVCWRTRRPGDFLAIVGGRKKIQDILIDDKVPKNMRDSVPMAAVGSEILFLPAAGEGRKRARYSHSYVLGADTKDIVFVEINGLIW